MHARAVFRFSCIVFSLIAIGWSADSCPAQTQESDGSAAKPQGKPIVVDADNVTYEQESGLIIGKDNVRIQYNDVQLRSDTIEASLKTNQAVAAGNVVLVQNEVRIEGEYLQYDFTTRQGTMLAYPPQAQPAEPHKVTIYYQDTRILADRIEFDLVRQEAVATDAVELWQGDAHFSGRALTYNFEHEQGSWSQGRLSVPPWFAGAERAVKQDSERVDLERAYLTTCDKENPHYRIEAKRVAYYIGDRIVAKNAVLYVGKVPVMYFPYWKHSLKDKNQYFTLTGGHKKDWGWFGLTTWRYYLNEHFAGRVHLDYRELKGFASGFDADYRSAHYGSGALKTYYMNERDTYESDAQERERYRAQLKHRWQVDSQTLALLEYNKISDFEFVKDYLYREYAADVQPVSQASWTHARPAYTLSAYARKQTNTFYSEVERLPELRYLFNSMPLSSTNLYYRHDMTLANLQKKEANSSLDTDANRWDMYYELKYPTQLPDELDWIKVAPYTATRQTFYSKDVFGNEENIWRGIQYYGFELSTQFFKTMPCQGSLLGVEFNKLRHIVTPQVQYSYIHQPTVDAVKLGQFDEIDAITKGNVFTFGIQNHLQTKWRSTEGEDESVDLLYFYPRVDYFPGRDAAGRYFSLITTECNLQPYRWVRLDSDTVYNQYQRRFQTANVEAATGNGDPWRIALGKRYDRDISNQLTGDFYYRLNDIWQGRVYGRYESYTDRFQEQQYTLYRDLHCWLFEFTYDIKLTDDGSTQDRTFWFIFRLKAFPEETPLQFNVGYDTTQRQ